MLKTLLLLITIFHFTKSNEGTFTYTNPDSEWKTGTCLANKKEQSPISVHDMAEANNYGGTIKVTKGPIEMKIKNNGNNIAMETENDNIITASL